MKNILLAVWCSMHLLLTTTATNAQITEDNKTLERKIDNYLKAGVTHGFSGAILIAKEGNIILNKGYGMANKEKQIPFKTNTISTIGSVTKQFTATAILKLVKFNKVKITDPISKFFNNLPNDKKDITLHQLLTHTAGFIDVIGNGDFDDIPMKRFFKTIFATKLLHEPGSKYAYSNSGYSILARIIEIASGQEYESFLNKHLFKPAGMNQTGYFIPKWNKDLIATGYLHNIRNVGTMISRFQKSGKISWVLKGNGGINSTTEDMYKWHNALKTNKILSKSLFNMQTTAHVRMYSHRPYYYGYGWAVRNSDRNTKIISHNGGNAIFFHDNLWLPKEDVVIMLFTNANSKEVEVAWNIEKMIFNKDHQIKPIKKNLHHLVFDFLKNKNLQHVNKFTTKIKEEYSSYLKKSDNLNDLGYKILSTSKNSPLAVALFKLNTELFPKNGNLWDSLGEGYVINGQKEAAKKSYKMALELAPKKDCHWCKNSAKALEELKSN
ncbi:serine hydrolase [Tenacibaculum sp.]|nr:serine hydrolase [Tenacibaculum sp.]